MGDIVNVDIETLGRQLKRHKIFGTIEAVKTVSDLYLPVSGVVVEMNSAISSHPELVNADDPYGKGRLIIVKMEDLNESTELLDASKYKKMIGLDAR